MEEEIHQQLVCTSPSFYSQTSHLFFFTYFVTQSPLGSISDAYKHFESCTILWSLVFLELCLFSSFVQQNLIMMNLMTKAIPIGYVSGPLKIIFRCRWVEFSNNEVTAQLEYFYGLL